MYSLQTYKDIIRKNLNYIHKYSIQSSQRNKKKLLLIKAFKSYS